MVTLRVEGWTGPVRSPENVRTGYESLRVKCHRNAAFIGENGVGKSVVYLDAFNCGCSRRRTGRESTATATRINANHAMIPLLAMLPPPKPPACRQWLLFEVCSYHLASQGEHRHAAAAERHKVGLRCGPQSVGRVGFERGMRLSKGSADTGLV
jgi:predicted ATPase